MHISIRPDTSLFLASLGIQLALLTAHPAWAADTSSFTPHPAVDQRGFIDVWALRDDVGLIEANRALDHSESCAPEEDEQPGNRSPAAIVSRSAEQAKQERATQACLDDNQRKLDRYEAMRSKFVAAWQPLLMNAAQKGDRVAEVILLNCDSTDIFDRAHTISTCAKPALAKQAVERLRQIGFKPAIPYQARLEQIRELASREQAQLALQELVLDAMRSGYLGLDSDILYRAGNYWAGTDSQMNLRLGHNAALIEAALQEFPRAFGIGHLHGTQNMADDRLARLALNRPISTPQQLTWGPALIGTDGRFGSDYFHNSKPFRIVECGGSVPVGTQSQSACTEHLFGTPPPVLPGVLGPNKIADTSINAELSQLLQQGEASIQQTLRDEPRWAIFLVNRPAHHEFVPERRTAWTQKLATEWNGDWQLVRSFQIRSRDQRFFKLTLPDQKQFSAILQIRSDHDLTSATLHTQNRGALAPADVSNCPLRYSGASTFPGGKLGFVENFIDNTNSVADVYPPAAFAPFDSKKRYRQVLMTCVGGETLGSDQVRFLLLAGDTLIEISAAGVANSPLTIRHYQRVIAPITPLLVDSENF